MTHEAENIILRAQLAAAHRLLDELAKRVGHSTLDPRPLFLTAQEIAHRLRINLQTFYQIARSGRLAAAPLFRLGGRGEYRVSEAEFDGWIESWKTKEMSSNRSNRSIAKRSVQAVSDVGAQFIAPSEAA